MKKRTRFGATWRIYVLVSVCTGRWTIIKEFVKITWNHFQTLHWQAWAAAVDVIYQIPSKFKIRGILKEASDDSVATSGEHVFCINRSVLNMNSKKSTWFCIKGCFSLLSHTHTTRCWPWKRRRNLSRLTPRFLWSLAPVFPSYLEAGMDLHLKYIYASCHG